MNRTAGHPPNCKCDTCFVRQCTCVIVNREEGESQRVLLAIVQQSIRRRRRK